MSADDYTYDNYGVMHELVTYESYLPYNNKMFAKAGDLATYEGAAVKVLGVTKDFTGVAIQVTTDTHPNYKLHDVYVVDSDKLTFRKRPLEYDVILSGKAPITLFYGHDLDNFPIDTGNLVLYKIQDEKRPCKVKVLGYIAPDEDNSRWSVAIKVTSRTDYYYDQGQVLRVFDLENLTPRG